MALRRNGPVPLELKIWELVEATGWTLEYIDSLSVARWHEYLQISDGRFKARSGGGPSTKIA